MEREKNSPHTKITLEQYEQERDRRTMPSGIRPEAWYTTRLIDPDLKRLGFHAVDVLVRVVKVKSHPEGVRIYGVFASRDGTKTEPEPDFVNREGYLCDSGAEDGYLFDPFGSSGIRPSGLISKEPIQA